MAENNGGLCKVKYITHSFCGDMTHVNENSQPVHFPDHFPPDLGNTIVFDSIIATVSKSISSVSKGDAAKAQPVICAEDGGAVLQPDGSFEDGQQGDLSFLHGLPHFNTATYYFQIF